MLCASVCSGVLEAGTYALCANKGKKERIGRLLMMHANNREDVKVARTGDIIAVAGLKDVITGETLCDEKAPIILERMEFPGELRSSLLGDGTVRLVLCPSHSCFPVGGLDLLLAATQRLSCHTVRAVSKTTPQMMFN